MVVVWTETRVLSDSERAGPQLMSYAVGRVDRRLSVAMGGHMKLCNRRGNFDTIKEIFFSDSIDITSFEEYFKFCVKMEYTKKMIMKTLIYYLNAIRIMCPNNLLMI